MKFKLSTAPPHQCVQNMFPEWWYLGESDKCKRKINLDICIQSKLLFFPYRCNPLNMEWMFGIKIEVPIGTFATCIGIQGSSLSSTSDVSLLLYLTLGDSRKGLRGWAAATCIGPVTSHLPGWLCSGNSGYLGSELAGDVCLPLTNTFLRIIYTREHNKDLWK